VRALLVANRDDADPGFVGQRLRHHGYIFEVCHRERPDEWPVLDGHELVLLLGSDWSVYWPAVAAGVGAERELVRQAHRAGLAILAICFGSQVLAEALGGRVGPASAAEIGWYDVEVDPSAGGLAAGPWLQWHGDVVDCPPGAVELARSPSGPQAWRIGRALAVQFHPEVDESILTRWVAGGADELRAAGVDPDELVRAARDNVAISEANAHTLVDWFVTHIASP
jgi:GMP synthase-like glutamine amidotransferase